MPFFRLVLITRFAIDLGRALESSVLLNNGLLRPSIDRSDLYMLASLVLSVSEEFAAPPI